VPLGKTLEYDAVTFGGVVEELPYGAYIPEAHGDESPATRQIDS
jgi:hypothetical protein